MTENITSTSAPECPHCNTDKDIREPDIPHWKDEEEIELTCDNCGNVFFARCAWVPLWSSSINKGEV